MGKDVNYLETFIFPDIPTQLYPVYSVSDKGNVFNLKNIIYPNSRSVKKFTRNKQLKNRSTQAKIFDAFINIGYFSPLITYREFPIIIQNSIRLPKLYGGFFLLDYYFPQLRLAVELDSDLHNDEKDKLRDTYLEKIGVQVFRIRNLEKESVQKTRFKELTKLMRGLEIKDYPQFSFGDNIRNQKGL